jgi:choline dehydrogenase-like flavoprotein
VPFLDFNHPLPAAALAGHDVVIVGAGAAGIFLAVKLSARGRRVLLLESGHFAPDADRQSLNSVEQSGKPLSDPIWNRKRIIGGTTTAWGGQSLPFSPLDFAPRPWVDHSGWPLAYEELAPHYAAANAFMRIDPWNYDTDLFRRLRRPEPGFAAGALQYHFSKWAPQPNFLKLERAALGRTVTVLYNAQVTRIDRDESGRASRLVITNFAGASATLDLVQLILAAGGIETTRLLLQNSHQSPGGIGNHSGWLGCGFMEHPSLVAGEIDPAYPREFQRQFGTQYHRGRRYSVRLSASAEWQRAHGLLNASATFLYVYPDAARDPLQPLRDLARNRHPRSLFRLIRHLPRLAETGWALCTDGFLYKANAQPTIAIMAEQEPWRMSRIGLGKTADRFGQRRADIHWSISALTWETIVAFSEQIEREVARLGLGRARLAPSLRRDEPDWARLLSDANHHMGGTRLSATPEAGVVNSDLQVWGIPNLFVCSCSVFPTSSHSNPTLTLLALCSRLAQNFPPAQH